MANDISTSFDKEMLLIDPNWGKDITANVAMQRRMIEQLGGVKTISQVITDAPISANCEYTLSDREGIYNLIQFFNDRNGRNESFWFLHPSRFFTLKEPYLSGNTYIKADRNFGELWTQGLSSQYDWGIYIKMHNGDLICRKVTGVTDYPDMTRVYLDETIPRNITNDNHYIIGRTLVGRFDQNELSVNFSAQGVGISTLKFTENYREYDAWVPIEGIRYWGFFDFNVDGDGATAYYENLTYPYGTRGLETYADWQTFGNDGVHYYSPHFKFLNINIPQYSGIITCRMRFLHPSTPIGAVNGQMTYNLSCSNEDNAVKINDFDDWEGKTRTTKTSWQVLQSTTWTTGNLYDTGDFAAGLQDVVNRPGWDYGNAIYCLFDAVSVSGYTLRYIDARDIPAGQYSARLIATWI